MDVIPSGQDIIDVILPFLAISYTTLVGLVMIVLSSVQEGAQTRGMKTKYGIENWSGIQLLLASGLVTLPSILILFPIGMLIAS